MSAPPGLTTPQLLRIVREIWIVVGDEVLGVESSWQESVESWCNENHCHFRPISLRGNRVLHTAGAVSNIVASIDNGTFLAGSDCLGAAFQDFSVQGAYLHLVMSEYGWKDMPASAQEWAHVNRFDNINCTLRAFAVDGRSTKEIYGGNEKLLRNTFKGMYGGLEQLANVAIGEWNPCEPESNQIGAGHLAKPCDNWCIYCRCHPFPYDMMSWLNILEEMPAEACKTKQATTPTSTLISCSAAQPTDSTSGAHCWGHYNCDGEDDTASLPRRKLEVRGHNNGNLQQIWNLNLDVP
eukprot:s805_g11.t1